MDPLLESDSITQDNLILMVRDLQERLKQIETHALTSQNIKANKIAVGAGSVLASISDGDIASIPFTDHSEDATIVGWSSFTTKIIRYKKVGNLVFVSYELTGTSDDTATSFTLPFSTVSTESQIPEIEWIKDNGTIIGTGIRVNANPPSNLVDFFTSINFATWTASGIKQIQGRFWYISA